MEYTLSHADADILVQGISENKSRITVKLGRKDIFMPSGTCVTSYPRELIEKILSIRGPAYLCDEIMRDESPEYVQKNLNYDVFSYIDKEQFQDTAVLDFGCGSGASTMILSRMLPETRIVGVELNPRLLEIALARSEFYKTGNRVSFFLSPNENSLPEDIGRFDFIFLSAVYEHLLPRERKAILPLLWSRLKPVGILFINQTPYRWFPVETHTTSGLVFINYMPDSIAFPYARRFSKRKLSNYSWPGLLRGGIRGGSAREIVKILKNQRGNPVLLSPNQNGLTDRIDLWFASLNKSRHILVKKFLFQAFKLIKASTGQTLLPVLSLAIAKGRG